MKILLTSCKEIYLSAGEKHVCLQAEGERCVVPLLNAEAAVEFQRVSGVVIERICSVPSGNSLLLIPQSDSWSGSMAVIADRVGVQGSFKSLLFCLCK